MAFVQDNKEDIFKEAIKQKILLFPLFKNKKLNKKGPLITGWQKLKQFDPDLMYEWREHFKDSIHSWAIQTDRWFLIDFDFGANFDQISYKKAFKEIRGNLKGSWFKGVKCKQKTKSGCHFFFKMPGNFTIEELEKAGEMVTNGEYLTGKFEALIRNRQGITGKHFGEHKGVDVKGINGYAEVKSVKLLKSLNNELIEAPYELLQMLRVTHHFGPGSNNKTAFVRGIKTETIKDLRETIKELFQKNEGRPNFDINMHLDDSLKVGLGKLVSKSNKNQEKEDFKKEEEDKTIETKNAKNTKAKRPIGFLHPALIHYDFNFIYGWRGIGKSRGVFYLIKEALKLYPDKLCGVISIDNDLETMLAPLLKMMKCAEKFICFDAYEAYRFETQEFKTSEKILIFIERVKKMIERNPDMECLFFDPLPKFFNWNDEADVSLFIAEMRKIAREKKICLIGVRNEGKSDKMKTGDAYKGTSAIGDDFRVMMRALSCEEGSKLAKKVLEYAKENPKIEESPRMKSFIVYTTKSSLFKETGFLFGLEIKNDVAVPFLVTETEDYGKRLEYLCTAESGKSLKSLIEQMIDNSEDGSVKLRDVYKKFEDIFDKDTILKSVKRNFKLGGDKACKIVYEKYSPVK